MLASIANMAAKPIIDAREFMSSALGVNGPKASFLAPRQAGTSDAEMSRAKRARTPAGSSATWRRMLSPASEGRIRGAGVRIGWGRECVGHTAGTGGSEYKVAGTISLSIS